MNGTFVQPIIIESDDTTLTRLLHKMLLFHPTPFSFPPCHRFSYPKALRCRRKVCSDLQAGTSSNVPERTAPSTLLQARSGRRELHRKLLVLHQIDRRPSRPFKCADDHTCSCGHWHVHLAVTCGLGLEPEAVYEPHMVASGKC